MTALLFGGAPLVGTFHAAGESAPYRYLGWGLRRMASRRSPCAARCRPTRWPWRSSALGGNYELLFNGIEVERFAAADPWPDRRRRPSSSSGATSPARASRCCSPPSPSSRPTCGCGWAATARRPRSCAQRFGHDPRIEWLGRISDEERAARMRGCTVYCSPSVRGESFGMVLLEAMAAGCALVASDLDGHRNVATDGVDALLAPVGDPAALAKALRRVLEDPGLRAELVAGGRRRADQLSMARLAERYAEIYARVVGAGEGARGRR